MPFKGKLPSLPFPLIPCAPLCVSLMLHYTAHLIFLPTTMNATPIFGFLFCCP